MTLVLHGPSYDPNLPEIAPEALASDINEELTTFWVPLTGAQMQGPLYLNDEPREANEAATKLYVDSHAGSGGGGGGGAFPDAPFDGKTYGRQFATWNQVLAAHNDVVDGGNFITWW